MYAYDGSSRTVPARVQYSATASGKPNGLAGVRELCGWLRQRPNTLSELRFSFPYQGSDIRQGRWDRSPPSFEDCPRSIHANWTRVAFLVPALVPAMGARGDWRKRVTSEGK